MRTLLLAMVCSMAALAQGGSGNKSWNCQAAADYPDGRMAWWATAGMSAGTRPANQLRG
jgi:hypothetical protein